jgi:hypothetical protein
LYNDLIEHFPTVLVLLGIFAAATVGLVRHFYLRMENKVDDIGKSLTNVVTRSECETRHKDLFGFIQAIVGITNCKNCQGEQRQEVDK